MDYETEVVDTFFEVTSTELMVSDPCYTDEGEVVKNVLYGKWLGKIARGVEHRPFGLLAVHEEFHSVGFSNGNWERVGNVIGVDSGQAGIFDNAHYKDDSVCEGLTRRYNDIICEENIWYSWCCDRTLDDNGAGTIPYGVVSSTGYGDGCYDMYVLKDKDNKTVVGIMIDFGLMEEDEETCPNCGRASRWNDYCEYCDDEDDE